MFINLSSRTFHPKEFRWSELLLTAWEAMITHSQM
jgi:hypothetical protein